MPKVISNDLIVLTAKKIKEKTGHWKGYQRTELYQNGRLKATFPAEAKQPKRGQKTILLNGWKFALKWE